MKFSFSKKKFILSRVHLSCSFESYRLCCTSSREIIESLTAQFIKLKIKCIIYNGTDKYMMKKFLFAQILKALVITILPIYVNFKNTKK